DRSNAERLVARGVDAVHVRRGGFEDEVGQLGLREQPVDTVRRRLEPEVGGPLESLTGRVDADHPSRLDDVRAQQLVHEVGAVVARPDDGRGLHAGSFPNASETEPRTSPKSPRKTSPLCASNARVQAPSRMTCPARRRTPNAATLRANHATEVAGLP